MTEQPLSITPDTARPFATGHAYLNAGMPMLSTAPGMQPWNEDRKSPILSWRDLQSPADRTNETEEAVLAALDNLSLEDLIDRFTQALGDLSQSVFLAPAHPADEPAPLNACASPEPVGEPGPSLAQSLAAWNTPEREHDVPSTLTDSHVVLDLSDNESPLELAQEQAAEFTTPVELGPDLLDEISQPQPQPIADLSAFFAQDDNEAAPKSAPTTVAPEAPQPVFAPEVAEVTSPQANTLVRPQPQVKTAAISFSLSAADWASPDDAYSPTIAPHVEDAKSADSVPEPAADTAPGFSTWQTDPNDSLEPIENTPLPRFRRVLPLHS